MAEALLFEHEDGRYAVNPDATGDPKWHRVGPVDVSALSTNAGEAAPVAFEWPKLEKPARAGGGVFRAGVSSRFVVEAAQRLYEASEVDRTRTPEEMQEDERKRRSLWDMIHGSPHPPAAVHGQSASTEVYLLLRNSGGASKRETVLGVFGTKAAADAEMERVVEAYHEEFPGYRQYGDAPFVSWSVRRHEVLATPPAAIPAVPVTDAGDQVKLLLEKIAAALRESDQDGPGWHPGTVYASGLAKECDQAIAALAQPAPVQQEAAGLPRSQEPKYTVTGSHIVNRASGEAIPHDEPVFIFRARDKFAVRALLDYAARCTDNHYAAVRKRAKDFRTFASRHPERMKKPDTAALQPTQGKGGA